MKKNLQTILVVALGLLTTVSYAQDWGVDSRTRINMSGDEQMEAAQSVTVGAAWGGSDWGIVLSSDVNYSLNDETNRTLSATVYEAYASTNLFGFATFNVGRQALEYGSGVFIAKNDWSMANRNTVDGMTFDINNDFVDLTLGLNNQSNADGSTADDRMWLNAGKSQDNWSMNLFYSASNSTTTDDLGESTTTDDYNQMGLDFAYSAMGGSLDLNVSYNTTSQGDSESDMMDISGTYNVNDDMTLTAGRTSVGENGFDVGVGGNLAGDWATHNTIGNLNREVVVGTVDIIQLDSSIVTENVMDMSNANQENLYIGGTYNMGAFSLSAMVHNVTNTEDDAFERNATQVTVGYSLGDNAKLSYSMVSDDFGSSDDTNYNYITLTITP